MAVFMLESLVLRGSAVLCGGSGVNTRLGTGYAVNSQTPEIAISMRHPSPGCALDFGQPAMRPPQAEDLRVDPEAAFGAGRSLSRAGVLSCRSAARNAARTVLSGWSPSKGGPKSTTATHLRLHGEQGAAFGIEAASGRLTGTYPRALGGCGVLPRAGKADKRGSVALAWCKPASRTPPASTRGMGVR